MVVGLEGVNGLVGEFDTMGNSAFWIEVMVDVPNIRKAFDQGKLMFNGSTLGFGALLGPGSCQLAGAPVATPDVIYLSSCSGDAPCFKVIYSRPIISKGRLDRQQLFKEVGPTLYMVGILRFFVVVADRYTEGFAKVWYDRYDWWYDVIF